MSIFPGAGLGGGGEGDPPPGKIDIIIYPNVVLSSADGCCS